MPQLYEKLVIKLRVKEKEPEVAQKKSKKKAKKDASKGISNPRYYENGLSPKQAQINRELGKVDILRL